VSADITAHPWRASLRGAIWLLVHGLLLALSLPPVGWWPLAFVSLVPVILAAKTIARISFRWRFASGLGLLPFWMFTHLWTLEVTAAGYIPLCIIVALISHIAVLLIALCDRKGISMGFALAACWTALEFFRGTLAFDGYPWAFVSHPLIEWWPAASPAIGSSVYAVTFLLAFLQGAAYELVQRRSAMTISAPIACLGMWIICAILGARGTEQPGRSIRIAAIQTNVPQSNKLGWNLDQQLDDWREIRSLATEAIQESPDLIIWPETMIPGITLSPQANEALSAKQIVYQTKDGRGIAADFFAKDLLRLQAQCAIPMLVGDEGIEDLRVIEDQNGITLDYGKRLNSVFLVQGGETVDRYDKIHLTPFGEVMPYIRAWPWLQERMLAIGASGMSFSLSAGSDTEPLIVRSPEGEDLLRAVTPICFESTDHALIRSMIFDHGARRADLIVFITNDGWFGDYDMIRTQHLQAARWRCLENATPGARAANTGLCAFIDRKGAIIAQGVNGNPSANRQAGVLVGECQIPVNDALPTTVPIATYAVFLLFFRRAKAD
jgi:apolipoprotein N-acyltransferase